MDLMRVNIWFGEEQILLFSEKNIFHMCLSLIEVFMQRYYKLPTAQHRQIALGSLPGVPYRLRKALEQVLPLCKPMSQPVQGDWLWEHQEEGQTFTAYSGQMHNVVDAKRHTIYIKPLQNIDEKFLAYLSGYCECFFNMKVRVMPHSATFLKGITRRINESSEREQLNAKEILLSIQKQLPQDAFCLIGVCMTDIYHRDDWNYVFGLASIKDRSGVFSFARYDTRFYETTKPYEIEYDRIVWISIGVMTHEITHMFGVRHCIYYSCLMNGSNHLEETTSKPLELCVVCLRKLQSNIGFDVLGRYEVLLKYISPVEDNRVVALKKYLSTAIENIRGNMKM